MTTTVELEARKLSVEYAARGGRLHALDSVDIKVQRGRFLAILGPSGSGKTTLLNAFAGFVRPTTGNVFFRGEAIAGPSVERAMVFQKHALLPWLDVAENVAFPLKLRGIGARSRRFQVEPLLDRVGLGAFASYPVWSLSGGMQQRVGLARALAADPAALLLDEPLGALDAITREDLQDVLVELWASSGKTVVLITHDIEEAVFLASDLVVLSDRPGRVVASIEVPFSARVAAGENARRIRTAPEFTALKAELRDVMDRHSRNAISEGAA
jgi:taurine transport system ATP-binding protein